MNRIKAISLAIKALQNQAQKLAVDSNLHDMYGLGGWGESAARQRKELLAAITELKEMHHDLQDMIRKAR